MSFANSQLISHQNITRKQAEQYVDSILSRGTTYVNQIDDYVQKHGVTQMRQSGNVDKTGLTGVADGHTKYGWLFQGKDVFYSYIGAFPTDLEPPPLCKKNAPQDKAMDSFECTSAISLFKQCHLFIFNHSRDLLVVQPLHIPQPDFIDGKPACFDVYGMAPAKVVSDAMLIVIGYNDSRWVCQNGPLCAGNIPKAREPEQLYKTTFLVRFNKDMNGQLVLQQDDVCMPPLNKYNTIASARKALKLAGCK